MEKGTSIEAPKSAEKKINPDKAEEFAEYAFPENPRAAELLERQLKGELSPDEAAELFTWERFPDNARARDLEIRRINDEKLTRDERIELDAYNFFPDSPEAQKLHIKSMNGELSPKEDRFLKDMRLDKYMREKRGWKGKEGGADEEQWRDMLDMTYY